MPDQMLGFWFLEIVEVLVVSIKQFEIKAKIIIQKAGKLIWCLQVFIILVYETLVYFY